MSYRIFETAQFRKELDKTLSPDQREIVSERLRTRVYPRLKKAPRWGAQIKKLKDFEPETWRYRVGDLRFFYAIDEEHTVVVMTAVRFRKDAYR